MIKKHLLKTILTATVVATLLTATACGSKQTSDNNTTVQQTTEAVKVVSNVDVKTEAEKPNEEADKPKEEAEKQPEQPAEAKEEQIEQPEENAEAVNTEAEVNGAQNTVSEEVQEVQAEPEATPAEQPAEATDTGAVDTTPVEQPAAPADTTPVPEPTPEPVVTPQEPAKPSVTEEQQLVATGKWTYTDDMNGPDNKIWHFYQYVDSITGYSLSASFVDGAFSGESANSQAEMRAIYEAHGITDTVCSFQRLIRLSNS